MIPSPHASHTTRSPLYPGNSSGGKFDFHPLRREKVVVGDFAIGQHLLLILVRDFRMHLASQSLRRFFRRDADRFAGIHVHKCGRDLSPVAELQRAFAEAASGDDGDSVGGAAIDFDEGYEPLSVFSLRIVDAEFLQAEHGETDAQHLPGAEVSVGLLSVAEIFVEGFHQTVALSLTPLQIHFLRQRMPSFVISTRMPASASSARIASEVLKSRAVRAAFMSAIFFSMSASESCPD